MNIESVRTVLESIRASAGDAETAHALEDRLWSDVLASIALGNPNAKELAAAALESQDIKFDRWYA